MMSSWSEAGALVRAYAGLCKEAMKKKDAVKIFVKASGPRCCPARAAAEGAGLTADAICPRRARTASGWRACAIPTSRATRCPLLVALPAASL